MKPSDPAGSCDVPPTKEQSATAFASLSARDDSATSGERACRLLGETSRHIHIVGIGGSGMSAIAAILSALGYRVSGSDQTRSRFAQRVEALGIPVFIGHDPLNVGDADLVAVSAAVRDTNPEVQEAVRTGIPVLSRAKLLGALTRRWRTVAVAGTHGKTSTTAFLVSALEAAGFDPGYIVGGELQGIGANARCGEGAYFVCEADESDGSFLTLTAKAAIITNVEADHLEHYGDLAGLEAAFARFLGQVTGPRVVGLNDPGIARVARGLDVTGVWVDGFRPVISQDTDEKAWYAGRDAAAYIATDLRQDQNGVSFRVEAAGKELGHLRIMQAGAHNVANSLSAFAMAVQLGASVSGALTGLSRCQGVVRRFDRRGEVAGTVFVDDYAHLPTEVRAAIQAARAGGWERVVAVFQPHLYSRTRSFAEEFGAALAEADLVIVTDVYPAREDPIPGVSGELVAVATQQAGGQCQYVPQRADLPAATAASVRQGDVCLSIGAGDVTTLFAEVAPLLQSFSQEKSATKTTTSGEKNSFSVETPGVARPEAAEETGTPAFSALMADPFAVVWEELRGILSVPPQRDFSLAPLTTYKVGGNAALFATVENEDELCAAGEMSARYGLPILMIGRGSNMLVSDQGFPGLALQLGAGFNWSTQDGVRVQAGAATPLPFLARQVAKAGLAGLEFGVGIPASVGGAVRMNAGGHGSEMSAVLEGARIMDLCSGTTQDRSVASLDLSYRHSNLVSTDVVLRADFRLSKGDATEIGTRLAEIVRWRKDHHPAGEGNCGSVFTNPPGDSAGRLIDAADCKNLRIGGAYVSAKHANFVMAEPWATAADVFHVIQAVRAKTREICGTDLVPELRLIGDFDFPTGARLDTSSGKTVASPDQSPRENPCENSRDMGT